VSFYHTTNQRLSGGMRGAVGWSGNDGDPSHGGCVAIYVELVIEREGERGGLVGQNGVVVCRARPGGGAGGLLEFIIW